MSIYKKFISYVIVGAAGVLVETLFFNLFLFFSSNFSYSKIFGLFFSLSFVFFMNRNFSFSARNGRVHKQVYRYVIVYAFAVAVNYSVGYVCSNILGPGTFNSNLASMLGIASAIPITFFGSLLWIFKDN